MNINWKKTSKDLRFIIDNDGVIIKGTVGQQSPNKPFYLTSSDLMIQRKTILDVNTLTTLSKEEKQELAKKEAIKTIKKHLEKKEPLMKKIIEGNSETDIIWNPFIYDASIDFGYIQFCISKKYNGQISIQKNCNQATFSLKWLFKNDVFLSSIDAEETKKETFAIIKNHCIKMIKILEEL